MAHYAKYTRGSAGSLTRHYERAKNSKGEYIKFKNQEIDLERTHLNYNLAPHQQSQLEFIKERTEEVKCLKRDDVKVMCDWVVTVPETVPEEHQREFFERVYQHLEDKYGKQNVVSAYVHMDETTPHLHFAFIPVVYDKKKDREKVSAKECVTREDLRVFHTELQEVLDQWREQKEYEFECDVLNGATENGNLTIEGLKAKELENWNALETEVLNDLIDQNNEMGGRLQMLQMEVESLSEERESLSKGVSELKAIERALEKSISTLEGKMDALKGDQLTLMQRFVENPKIKPTFDTYCRNMSERATREKDERTERKSVVGSLGYYKEQIEQMRQQRSSSFTAEKPQKSHHKSSRDER